MKTISIKVPESMHQEMKRLNINWSGAIRKLIEDKLEAEKMKKACKIQDGIRKKTSGDWSGTEEIRKWRNMKK